MYGWRARIGFLSPAPGGLPTSLLEMQQLAPEGVSFTGRFLDGPRSLALDDLRAMAPQVGPAAKQLAASASLDVIVMGGAPVVLANGPDDVIAAMQEGSGVPSTTNVDGIVKGLARLGISRVVVMAPYYPDHLLELTRSHLTSKGLEVVSLVSGGDIPFETHKNVRDIDTYRAAKKAFLTTPGAEGLVIVGGGAPLSAVIGILETDIAAPVVANNFASLWNALDMVSVRTPIEGYGRLLTLL